MFGLNKMRKQRELLYARTQRLETRAEESRKRFVQTSLDLAVRPEGLVTSFILGLTTQCDLANKGRESLLKTAGFELIGSLKEGLLTSMKNKSASSSDGNSKGL